MALEEDKSGSMSDKDRKMAETYEFKNIDDEKEDKDTKEKEDDEKSDKKVPKKSLFFGSKEEVTDSEEEKDKTKEKSNLFAGLLKKDLGPEEGDAAGKQLDEKEAEELRDDFQEIVIDHQEAVETELSHTPAENEAAVQANADFLENVEDRLEEGMGPEAAIDDAFEDEIEPPQADATEADLVNQEFFDAEEEEENKPTTSSTTSTPTPPPPPPPTRTGPPVQPPPPPPPNFNQPQPQNPNISPNTQINQQQNLNVVPQPQDTPEAEPDKRRRAKDRLAGGIIGYMIGRRGGRKRTEARLQPEIDRRDEELKDLENKLNKSEESVRKITAEKSELTVEKAEEKVENVEAQTAAQEARIIEKQEKAFEERLAAKNEQPLEAETNPVEQTIEGPEQVGSMVERLMPPAVKTETLRTEEKVEVQKDPHTMTIPELLEVAAHIHLEKTSLREMYERKRIDAINLRRVVIEYFEGGNHYEKILRGSLEAVEMQRELRGEIRNDDNPIFQPIVAGTSYTSSQTDVGDETSVPGLSSATTDQLNGTGSDSPSDLTQQLLVSNRTAVIAGSVAGAVILIFLLIIF